MAGDIFQLDKGCDWSQLSGQLDRGVSVILRTKDRPLFLRRALASIVSQEFPDLTLYLVNDGSDRTEVEKIARSCLPKHLHVELIHNDRPIGQPAALNVGLTRVSREFFAVHDDDDTWSPLFLKKMVAFLQEERNKRFIGAVSYCDQVSEFASNDKIHRLEQRLHIAYPPVLRLIDILHPPVHPPPISQLMRQTALTIAGQMNTELPVMYDYEWTIRLMRLADIVTLPEVLAYYHYRSSEVADTARNSVFESMYEYEKIGALLDNQLLRRDLDRGQFGFGLARSLVHLNEAVRRLDVMQSDQVLNYLKQRARSHARRRQLRRSIESPFRNLAKWLFGRQ